MCLLKLYKFFPSPLDNIFAINYFDTSRNNFVFDLNESRQQATFSFFFSSCSFENDHPMVVNTHTYLSLSLPKSSTFAAGYIIFSPKEAAFPPHFEGGNCKPCWDKKRVLWVDVLKNARGGDFTFAPVKGYNIRFRRLPNFLCATVRLVYLCWWHWMYCKAILLYSLWFV